MRGVTPRIMPDLIGPRTDVPFQGWSGIVVGPWLMFCLALSPERT